MDLDHILNIFIFTLKGSSKPSDLSENTLSTSGMILGSKGLFQKAPKPLQFLNYL